MEMSLTTEQLCARARYRERENVWFRWITVVPCLGLGAACVYWTVTMGQIWFRLAAAWLAVLMAHALWGSVRVGARRFRAGESCAQFMVRELEGSRRTLLALQWGMVLVLPPLSMFWWGAYRTMEARGLRLSGLPETPWNSTKTRGSPATQLHPACPRPAGDGCVVVPGGRQAI